MTATIVQELAETCIMSGRIDAQDVRILAREIMPDGIMDRASAEALMAMETAAIHRAEEWRAFFVQSLADYVLFVERPTGRVTAKDADWLIENLDMNGSITAIGRELLVTIVREADEVDPRLAPIAYAYVTAAPRRAKVATTLGWLDSAGIGS